MTVKQAAEYLKFNLFSIRRLASQGALKPYTKAGKSLLFLRADIDNYRLSNAWARKKAGLEKTTEQPAEASPKILRAEIHVDLGFGTIAMHPFGTKENFSWQDLPLIKAEIDAKHGSRPFEVSVSSPDGGRWSIEYNPPPMLHKLLQKLMGK